MVFRDKFASCVNCGVTLEEAGLAERRFLKCADCGGAWVSHQALERMFVAMRWDARVEIWSAADYRAATGDAALVFSVTEEGVKVGETRVDSPVIKIGRLSSSHVRLDDPSVSRMHAVVELTDEDGIHIIDLGSATGTMVNGVKVNKAALKDGDVLTIGSFSLVVSTLSHGSSDGPPSRHRCLDCQKQMAAKHIEEINVDVCDDHGVWFDARELQQVLEHAAD